MLEQLLNIVKQFGENSVVNNPDVPNEHNQGVLQDATKTIASGFQNILAGGGFQNILDLFKGNSQQQQGASGSGIGGLIKNPIVTMMIGYFISKLVNKYKMSPASASGVANSLIPDALNGLISQVNDPSNPDATLDNLVGSLTGGNSNDQQEGQGGSQLQDILDSFTGNGGGNSTGGGGINLQDIISSLAGKAQNSMENREAGSGGGLLDMIKGFFN